MKQKIAIVGSRNITDYEIIKTFVLSYIDVNNIEQSQELLNDLANSSNQQVQESETDNGSDFNTNTNKNRKSSSVKEIIRKEHEFLICK